MSDPAEKTVVNLNEYGQLRRSLGNGPGGNVLREVQKLGTQQLQNHLQRMMEKVDDTLFQEAKKAESNMIQTLYFDAMRELRIIRTDIEKDFSDELDTAFTRGLPRKPSSASTPGLSWNEGGESSLGLVEKDDMEEELAITNMVHKVRGTSTRTLFALDKRIGFLIQDPDLENWQNPLGPEAVCNAFHTAAKRIETGVEIRLVIFKLFDQEVVSKLEGIYKELNQRLVAMGVLPEIRASVTKPSVPANAPQGPAGPVGAVQPGGESVPGGATAPAGYAPDNGTGGSGVATGVPSGYPGMQGAPAGNFAAPQGAPAGYNGVQGSTGGAYGGTQGMPGSGYNGAAAGHSGGSHGVPGGYGQNMPGNYGAPQGAYPASGGAPIQALTMLQQGALPGNVGGTEGGFMQIDPTNLASGQVNVLHEIRQSPVIQDMGKTGDMTINMVAMLFDYILDDRNIPGTLRAMIGRLQIPVLKVALLDREFFSHKSHPARLLLNSLASIAMGWDEQQGTDDPVYRKIESTVTRILDDFEDDVSLFSSLLDDLEGFVEKNEAQAEVRAQRSARLMEGQEKLDVAKSTTMEEIQPRLDDSGNLDFVREFVTTHWKNLLFLSCARDGKDSDAWKQAVRTMDELVWSIKPKRSPEERQRLVAIQPELLQNLREGMERLSVDVTERDDFLARLVRAHGRTAVTPDEVEQEIAQENATGAVTPTEPTAAEQAKPATPEPEPAEINDEYTTRAQHLKTGTWLEFHTQSGQTKRAKLSWASPITGTLLFTDRQGLKAGNFSITELAHLLRSAQAQVVNTAPLMDRAVDTILRNQPQPQ
jgi:hypothetical protein